MGLNGKQYEELMKNAAKGVRVISKDSLQGGKVAPVQPQKPKGEGRYPAVQKVADSEDGTVIHSKLEAKHRKEYRLMLRTGLIKAYSKQPEFVLAGGVKYVSDHLIIHLDGSFEVVDSKGIETTDFKIKMKLMTE